MDPLSIKQFQDIDDAFNQALTTNNARTITDHLDPNWVLIEGQFGVTPRDTFLAAIDQGRLTHTAMKKNLIRLDVRDDVAVVTSRGRNVGMFAGNKFDSEQWVTSVYRRDGNRWLCVVTQETPVSC